MTVPAEPAQAPASDRDVSALLAQIDSLIERELVPLQEEHPEYFDHRREFARTDLERDGIPKREWEELLLEMTRRADAAGPRWYATTHSQGLRNSPVPSGEQLALTALGRPNPGLGLGASVIR